MAKNKRSHSKPDKALQQLNKISAGRSAARKKKSTTAGFFSRARKNPAYADLKDVAATVGAGLGAYGVNRIGVLVIKKLLNNKLGWFTKHIGPIASLGLAAIIWYVADKWTWLRRHHNGVIAGSGLAVVQTLISTYVPALTWLFNYPTALNHPAVQKAIAQGASPATVAALQTAVDQGLLAANSSTAAIDQDGNIVSADDDVIDETDYISAVMDDSEGFNTGVFASKESKGF